MSSQHNLAGVRIRERKGFRRVLTVPDAVRDNQRLFRCGCLVAYLIHHNMHLRQACGCDQHEGKAGGTSQKRNFDFRVLVQQNI